MGEGTQEVCGDGFRGGACRFLRTLEPYLHPFLFAAFAGVLALASFFWMLVMADGLEKVSGDDLDSLGRVHLAERLVAAFDANMGPKDWKNLLKSPSRVEVLEQYLTCKCLVDFDVFFRYGCYFGQIKHYDPVLHLGPSGARHYRSSGLIPFLSEWEREEHGHVVPVSLKAISVNRWNCKTQSVMAWYVWRFVRDVNERMMLRSFTDQKVHEIMSGMRELFLKPQFRERFTWVRPAMENRQRKQWSQEAILLEREIQGIRTASVETYGMKSTPTGGHYTVRGYDDWETEASAESAETTLKLCDTYQLDSNLCNAGCKTVVIGTPHSRGGFIDQAIRGIGIFEAQTYDLFVQPATIRVFDEPFMGQEPVLLKDRVTLRCEGADFPVGEDTLEHCQSRVMFFSTAAQDTVCEVREVVWNDGTHFRVNRPFPDMLGQPLSFRVLPDKPAAPTRFTLDSVDWEPAKSEQADKIARMSLERQRREQGSYIYSCQQDLNPIDPGAQLYNDAMVHWVEPDELPGEPLMRRFYQTVDLAGKKKTECYTSILNGYHFSGADGSGVCVTNLTWGNLSVNEAIFAIFMGAIRAQRMFHSELEWTSFEAAAREEVLRDNLLVAERDPLAYFELGGGKLAALARQEFESGQRMHLRKKHLSRGVTSKGLRFLSIQPFIERGDLYVVKGIAHEDRLREEMNTVTRETDAGFDVWDTVTDLIREGRPPGAKDTRDDGPVQEGMFSRIQREAIFANTMRNVGRGGWRT